MVYIEYPRGYKTSVKLKDTHKKNKIIEEATNYLNLSVEQLKRKDRFRDLVYGRKLIFYFLKKHTRFSDHHIGQIFNRHRTTVIHDLNDLDDLIETDPTVRHDISFLEQRITA